MKTFLFPTLKPYRHIMSPTYKTHTGRIAENDDVIGHSSAGFYFAYLLTLTFVYSRC